MHQLLLNLHCRRPSAPPHACPPSHPPTPNQDIKPTWESFIKLLDYNQGLSRFGGQGSWGDADMLEGASYFCLGARGLLGCATSVTAATQLSSVIHRPNSLCPSTSSATSPSLTVGNGKLTLGEQRAHFALWALLKSPLLIGADLRHLNPDSLSILKAKEIIAINQDELGVPGDLVWVQGASRVRHLLPGRGRGAGGAVQLGAAGAAG